MSTAATLAPRTVLFLPASNPRAIEKARGLPADMIILDLEDAVKEAEKDAARDAAVAAAGSFGDRLVGIRINASDSKHWQADLKAVSESAATHVVVPKVEQPAVVVEAARRANKPVLAMIETPAGVMNLSAIVAQAPDLAGLIAGTNDLAAGLRLPADAGRGPLATALQLIVLAARAQGLWTLDGVFNRLDDPEGLAAECREGRMLGFDGKTLIHPNQIEIAAAAFAPTEVELDEARALVAAATGGAERYKDAMIEAMHVERAKALLART